LSAKAPPTSVATLPRSVAAPPRSAGALPPSAETLLPSVKAFLPSAMLRRSLKFFSSFAPVHRDAREFQAGFMSKDLIPGPDAEFDTFLRQLTAAVTANPAAYGLTAADVVALQAALAHW